MTESRWSKTRVNAWAAEQGWLVGCNFIPSTASNQFEMWQQDTFDPETISRELAWASALGMNGIRVFLHDLVWLADPDGFKSRIDHFLQLTNAARIKTMLVLFDDCWFPPIPGKQQEPVPGVHNSRWAQSPGHDVVKDRSQWPRLEAYVRDIVTTFGDDPRVCLWDLYNEPGNAILPLASSSPYFAAPRALARLFRHFILPSPTLPLLDACFQWARAVDPMQPLTVGVWAPNPRLNKLQLEQSDVISFHQYMGATALKTKIKELKQQYGRPVLCTEWMARTVESRIETHLPIFKEEHVGCFTWGLVSGRTQTIHSWTDRPGSSPPALWHHDLLHPDGSAYSDSEIEVIKRLTTN